MKYFIAVVCILVSTSQLFSQSQETKDSIKIELKATSIKGKEIGPLVIPVKEKDTSVDITSEYWDTTVFNPYKEALVKYPIKIEFNDSVYVSPITRKKVITSRYGWRRGRPHKGIDIDLITGDSVVSMLDGIVRFAKYSYGHGNTVVVRHYNGLETVYAHLSKIKVKPNDSVKAGDLLGKGGNTGRSTGSHLHLVANYKGNFIHPEYLFDFSEDNGIRASEIWITRKHTNPQLHSAYRLSKFDILDNEELALANLLPKLTYYTVKPGDTLSRISRRNNVSIAALCKTNKISRSSVIKVGQKILIEHL
ncbi:peptidoglycan DD-metalloendopeptidase family protein [Winogradskyella sp. A3E31]|uniref:peptidoglycan DD-metalloendopeptidase family protein n=1 Tax=Winogradskyella sp. A3E31 TaxID=3349637 RepID=UPI00398BB84E